mmetsp:Transcript_137265/g.342201  ORF Transcript_137265/g.342201 Transcript_137265/m.342201 type:complete len:342 (+) Transcript_137265:669-1694(+)
MLGVVDGLREHFGNLAAAARDGIRLGNPDDVAALRGLAVHRDAGVPSAARLRSMGCRILPRPGHRHVLPHPCPRLRVAECHSDPQSGSLVPTGATLGDERLHRNRRQYRFLLCHQIYFELIGKIARYRSEFGASDRLHLERRVVHLATGGWLCNHPRSICLLLRGESSGDGAAGTRGCTGRGVRARGRAQGERRGPLGGGVADSQHARGREFRPDLLHVLVRRLRGRRRRLPGRSRWRHPLALRYVRARTHRCEAQVRVLRGSAAHALLGAHHRWHADPRLERARRGRQWRGPRDPGAGARQSLAHGRGAERRVSGKGFVFDRWALHAPHRSWPCSSPQDP